MVETRSRNDRNELKKAKEDRKITEIDGETLGNNGQVNGRKESQGKFTGNNNAPRVIIHALCAYSAWIRATSEDTITWPLGPCIILDRSFTVQRAEDQSKNSRPALTSFSRFPALWNPPRCSVPWSFVSRLSKSVLSYTRCLSNCQRIIEKKGISSRFLTFHLPILFSKWINEYSIKIK